MARQWGAKWLIGAPIGSIVAHYATRTMYPMVESGRYRMD